VASKANERERRKYLKRGETEDENWVGGGEKEVVGGAESEYLMFASPAKTRVIGGKTRFSCFD